MSDPIPLRKSNPADVLERGVIQFVVTVAVIVVVWQPRVKMMKMCSDGIGRLG